MIMPSLAARPLLSSSIENHLQRLIGPDASALMNRPPLEYQPRLSQHLRLGHVCIRAGLDTAGTDSLIGRANCLGERVGVAMFDGLAAWLGESNAAVICLQEVARTAGATGDPIRRRPAGPSPAGESSSTLPNS
jgi:hypothetical protein